VILKIYEFEISIESNPTSNRKIFYINKYTNLQILNANKYILEQDDEQVFLLTFINIDDSAIFQISLSRVYAYIASALMKENYPREYIFLYKLFKKNSIIQSFYKNYKLIK